MPFDGGQRFFFLMASVIFMCSKIQNPHHKEDQRSEAIEELTPTSVQAKLIFVNR